MQNISESFALALEHHQAGRLQVAERIYREILQADPHHADVWHLLGFIAHQVGRHETAVEHIEHAIRMDGMRAASHHNLGDSLRALGRLADAAASYQRALRLEPNLLESHFNLGFVWRQLGQPVEAIACFRRAVELKPDDADARNALAAILAAHPESADLAPAAEPSRETADDCNRLGVVLAEQGKLDDAIVHLRRALRRNPNFAEAHNNLGGVLLGKGELEEAVACFQRALQGNPDMVAAHSNLGNAWRDQGELTKAIACYRRAIEIAPDAVGAHSNLLYALIFSPDHDAQTVMEEHRRWNRRHAEPLAKHSQPHANDRSPDRRLKIGYVSPDFKAHPVGRWLLPLLEAHHHDRFEIFCYASVNAPDSMTARCRACADVWREAVALNDAQLADLIRQDRIDILVDVTMHMSGSRLLTFARKPAPVQVTYLAYPGTTGLSAVDYRMTDPFLDPPEQNDQEYYSEECIRLPETSGCYQPVLPTPDVNALPALTTGQVTFSCLNNFCKVVTPALEAWGLLMRRVPASRLLLFSCPGYHRDRVRDHFARYEVASDRIDFVERLPSSQYFRMFHRIDIALDPFPYGGGTTTCDALWMGVPVVSLTGPRAISRSGLAILANARLPELIAADVDEYVRIAANLAEDLPRLSALRSGLRDKMLASPMMDAQRLVGHFEAAYRTIWRRWCERAGA